MSLTASEQATLHFYNWEYRHRGYYHFDTPIDIEVPYIPFRHALYSDTPIIDDGRAPSLLKSISNLFSPQKEEEPLEELAEVKPRFLVFGDTPNLVGVSLSFPKGTEILPNRNVEFLNMLSFTEHLLSFEIIGDYDDIYIQIICSEQDKGRISSHLHAYFPTVILREIEIDDFGFNIEHDIAIADFGLNDEYMRSITTSDSFSIDPLTSIIATMDSLQQHDVAVFQILFKGITSPLAKDILYSVSDGSGGSFFADAPEMPKCAHDKIANPLFSVVMRIATQGENDNRSQYLAQELARSISTVSSSEHNFLIPLSNEGYKYDFHYYNLHNRLSNRLGFILNSKELNTFLHYPNKTVVSQKLGLNGSKTKRLPKEAINQKYVLGINQHNGEEHYASISDDIFSKHIVVGGSTGTGKTHLLKQLISQDLRLNNSSFVLDPHGDLALDILKSTPQEKKDEVIYINIADEGYSFGFNIFSANSDAEKTVLASDLASAFADSWISSGDRIQSVLQKTISTFIYSEKEASILDMKRFLLEQGFRNEFLQTLDDPILMYYWENEFPLVRRNELSPLLLRIDSFMQTRLLRNVFCQTKGVDFRELIEQRKLVLIQLSVGLIGLENSKFLARLIISKINQIAFSRQTIAIEQRLPIHLYIDESHNYANSPVIEQILSGARKYKLNLVLVLQHLEQVSNNLLNSILTNTATQIFFRQSDKDSKRIASSFSFFEAEDFMELDRGEALVRINKRSNDFNLQTLALQPQTTSKKTKEYIIEQSRIKYAVTVEEITELLKSFIPTKTKTVTKPKPKSIEVLNIEPHIEPIEIEEKSISIPIEETISDIDKEKELYFERLEKKELVRKHQSLQEYVRVMAIQRGFKAIIEEATESGGRVDVGLTKNLLRIGVEISVTNTKDYEVQNLIKCIESGYTNIAMLCESKVHLKNIKTSAKEIITKENFKDIHFCIPSELPKYLDKLTNTKVKEEQRIQGYRITTSFKENTDTSPSGKQQELTDIILSSIRSKNVGK